MSAARPRAARRLRHLAGYAACRAALAILALLPRRAGLAVGRALGRAFHRVARSRRRVALANLERAFPGMPPAERARVARAAFANLGAICVDAAYFPRLLRQPTERLAVYEGLEHLRAAAARGKGLLVYSAHFGHWEMIGLLQARLGLPFTMVVRPLDNPWIDRLLSGLRVRAGNALIPKREAARGVLRALRSGGAIALLIDQNVHGDAGIFVDFFGVPASTTPALATFALKCGSPIVPVFCHPLPDGRVRIAFQPEVPVVRRGALADDIAALTRACTAVIETEVRRRPDLWLWMHNRWRTRPRPGREAAAGEPAGPAAAARRAGDAAGHARAEARP